MRNERITDDRIRKEVFLEMFANSNELFSLMLKHKDRLPSSAMDKAMQDQLDFATEMLYSKLNGKTSKEKIEKIFIEAYRNEIEKDSFDFSNVIAWGYDKTISFVNSPENLATVEREKEIKRNIAEKVNRVISALSGDEARRPFMKVIKDIAREPVFIQDRKSIEDLLIENNSNVLLNADARRISNAMLLCVVNKTLEYETPLKEVIFRNIDNIFNKHKLEGLPIIRKAVENFVLDMEKQKIIRNIQAGQNLGEDVANEGAAEEETIMIKLKR